MMFSAVDACGFEITFMADDWEMAEAICVRNCFKHLARYVRCIPCYGDKPHLRVIR